MTRSRLALKRPAPNAPSSPAAGVELEQRDAAHAAHAAAETPPSSDISDDDVDESTGQFSDDCASSDVDARAAPHPHRRAAEAKQAAVVVEALKRDHR